MTTAYTPPVQGTGFKASVQRLGGHLAGMVMPNIGAFLAWGLLTALFIPTGWLPNKTFGALVDPMILSLLPLLIGYTGGKIVHGTRGGVIGAVATMGVIVGVEKPQFMAAMLMGPLAAWLLKRFDKLIEGKVKPGFEMLVDNFSAGIIGGAMAMLGLKAIGPVFERITEWAGNGVDWLVSNHMLGVVSVLVEPAKVLFLNNAINHGVFDPLAVDQVHESGKSILFMIETNPGPGLGLLLAFMLFGPRALRPSTPAAMVIHFLGGIHEIYFPYVLMKPRLILAMIAGGMSGVVTYMITGAGLVASPAPGSIFAYFAVTPKGGYITMILGVIIACAVTFGVASVLLGFGHGEPAEEIDPDQTEAAFEQAKAESDARHASAKSPSIGTKE